MRSMGLYPTVEQLAAQIDTPVKLTSWQINWGVGVFGTPSYLDRPCFFRKIRYIPWVPNSGSFTAELRDVNTGVTVLGSSSGASAANVRYVEIDNSGLGFNFAKDDMPYVYMTATSGTAGLGLDAWLIP